MTIIAEFIDKVDGIYSTGSATEHSYRSSFENLFQGLGVTALNEPKRVKCGAPDFILTRGSIVVGHLETKDLTVPIRGLKDANKKQQERYKAALPNLIYSNGLEWDFYRDGELVSSVAIANLQRTLVPRPEQYETLENLLREFIAQQTQTINSPRDLAERMAGKAILIKDVLHNALIEEIKDKTGYFDNDTELSVQYRAFKENLIHDITPEDFADIYAETIAYGMFAARLHDTTLDSFSRQEALDLLPKSNPFLRSLFGYIAGHDLDDRIAWIIDDLANVFQACDVASIMEGFGKLTGREDPFLHFYETFLAAYNPDKRKARGVWYTPEPVVNFIIRAVDEVLQNEFGLPDGVADTSKVTVDWDTGQTGKGGKPIRIKKEVHRVQILDPAIGTGTFLAEVIKQIAPKVKYIAGGIWSNYIEAELIPRLHGFELLMASYAMCHMKLDMILTELGYKPKNDPPRLSVYLTNSLEEGEPANQTLPFTRWLSREAKGANTIKRDMPIMCIIGNPPYLGEGGVSDGWIGQLMNDYKREPNEKVKLRERNPKWLNDLYVKFIRMSSHLIEKNGEGVLGFITNHGYLDNPTFRGMRWHLTKTFDQIWILNLHGNVKKKERTPEGAPDENVFDILQGVAIIIAVKRKDRSSASAEIMQGDLWGTRLSKYMALQELTLRNPVFARLESPAPQHLFVRRDYALQKVYERGFSVRALMPINSVGVVTARDSLTIDLDRDRLWRRVRDFSVIDSEMARHKYQLGKDAKDWQVELAQADVRDNLSPANLTQIDYRPFDVRWTYYTGSSRGFMCRSRDVVMRHMRCQNIALACSRQVKGVGGFHHVFCHLHIAESSLISNKTSEISSCFPLYIYPDDLGLDATPRVNLDRALWTEIQKRAKDPQIGIPSEIQVFDYVYGVLHSPSYREMFADFLKSDFPRIPWPSSSEDFWAVSTKGTHLRKLHLMEPDVLGTAAYPLKGDGNNLVERPEFLDGKVWINKTQYFEAVAKVSWEFYIGGYQPAQKWLKDRKGQELDFNDVRHYQRILKVLSETDRIMRTIMVKFDTA